MVNKDDLINRDDLRNRLGSDMPVTFPITKASELSGWMVATGTIRNAISRGDGPDGVFYCGRKVMLCRKEFLDWLLSRLTFKTSKK
jgi:hypothetical protein